MERTGRQSIRAPLASCRFPQASAPVLLKAYSYFRCCLDICSIIAITRLSGQFTIRLDLDTSATAPRWLTRAIDRAVTHLAGQGTLEYDRTILLITHHHAIIRAGWRPIQAATDCNGLGPSRQKESRAWIASGRRPTLKPVRQHVARSFRYPGHRAANIAFFYADEPGSPWLLSGDAVCRRLREDF